ncbi:16S rRNA (cytosine(1402)-N(4))-methyltransferase RsmH [Sulfurirhabdus autotrophica]|uniref:Ribosomal RNA small subunit methyltransferase H n=1 Tax=Sulfurirhabdus autotrophica TaxID=1706046 RepID=A0A4R3XVR9_9PROT|nr:16S rRNA (cytosine(1402)-N(4))-methyltransferase RsmH [Sulfurirhabdus autotrophica]TCV83027.1 16S rRNA (cytosine1402-N4)-methyltransferase [Sulfurirhabdus autotrophica]
MSDDFVHKTVLLYEAVDSLNVQPDGVYVDGTFGRGGHSRLILEKLGQHGRLIALDKDPAALQEAGKIKDSRFQIVHSGFAKLQEVLNGLGVAQVNGVLLDLGVSSPQLDEAARGFSFRFDGPLDMRMDVTRGQTASEWLTTADEKEIGEVIKNYGEERFAKQVARAIVTAREGGIIATTRQLAEIVAKAVRTREPNQDPATRTFQALRIYLNQELEELSLVLPQCVSVLAPGGRLVVISFHSLEDRIVKRFTREVSNPDTLPSRLPIRAKELPVPVLRLVGKVIRASDAEVAENPRSRSAVMRVAEKAGEL